MRISAIVYHSSTGTVRHYAQRLGELTGLPVYSVKDLYDFCLENNVDIGVLTVPKEAAYEVSMVMINAGVKGLWNFANMELQIDSPDVIVENIHLGDSLMKLCYELKTKSEDGATD